MGLVKALRTSTSTLQKSNVIKNLLVAQKDNDSITLKSGVKYRLQV